MTRISRLVSVILLSMASAGWAGELQISCETGLRVYLDGEFVGLSSAREDGLYLLDLEPGNHQVWVEKDGFLSQRFEVEVGERPSELKVGEFIPLPKLNTAPPPLPSVNQAPKPAQNTEVGELTITSAPQICEVEIDGSMEIKDKPVLTIGGLHAGPHVLSFRKEGYEPISRTVEVIPGASINVRGNLIEGRVELFHEGEGDLNVTCNPRHCSVVFDGQVNDVVGLIFKRTKVPAGEYPIGFTYRGMKQSATVLIKDGYRTMVKVNFIGKGEPVVVSYEKL